MINRYLFYALRPKLELLKSISTGAATKFLTLTILNDIEIKLPPLLIQQKIVSILSAYDDLIENNTRRIAILEEMAQMIYREWFVKFRFPGHEKVKMVDSPLGKIPEGWRIMPIGEVCDFLNGYAFKSKELTKDTDNAYKVFKMGLIKKGGGLNRSGVKSHIARSNCKNLDRFLIKKGDLLMCMTDMKSNVALLGHTALMDTDDEFILNQRVGLLRTKDQLTVYYPFLYILTNSKTFLDDLRSRANSGVQVNLSTSEIKKTKFLLPAKSIHIAFNQIAEPISKNIFNLVLRNQKLIILRDLLLPKLISDELDVSDLDIEILGSDEPELQASAGGII